MDMIKAYGFIPNGARLFYLNRSQPPLFIQMVNDYVKATNDTAFLDDVLELADRELQWWATNRTLEVRSPFTNVTHNVSRYAVVNSAPRPEVSNTKKLDFVDPPRSNAQRSFNLPHITQSYLEDYITAFGAPGEFANASSGAPGDKSLPCRRRATSATRLRPWDGETRSSLVLPTATSRRPTARGERRGERSMASHRGSRRTSSSTGLARGIKATYSRSLTPPLSGAQAQVGSIKLLSVCTSPHPLPSSPTLSHPLPSPVH